MSFWLTQALIGLPDAEYISLQPKCRYDFFGELENYGWFVAPLTARVCIGAGWLHNPYFDRRTTTYSAWDKHSV